MRNDFEVKDAVRNFRDNKSGVGGVGVGVGGGALIKASEND